MSANLTKAFARLRKQGIFARQNYWCCQSCGCASVGNDVRENPGKYLGYVFYHGQDNERRRKNKDFYLAYGTVEDSPLTAEKVAELVLENLAVHGIKAEWNGDTGTRIKIVQQQPEPEFDPIALGM